MSPLPIRTLILSSVALLALLIPEAAGFPSRNQATPALKNTTTPVTVGKAVYLITNDGINSVVALPVSPDGTVSAGTLTKTGGAGSVALNTNGQPETPDALLSQSALTIAGNFIFAVNAACNTLSMLLISPSDPTSLTLVGQAASIPGDFPNTVAASLRHNLVCVGTTGARSGISCTNFSSSSGLGKMDRLRPFGLNQTTPPVGPFNTVSQTFFSEDESTLFTTVKGDPAANKTGFLSAFSVQGASQSGRGGGNSIGASLARTDTRNSPQGTAVLFGSQVIPGTKANIFATDASFGAAILSVVDSDHRGGGGSDTKAAKVLARVEVPGQKATCWATISPATGTAFVTDVGVNRLIEMSLEDASILGELDLSANGDPGLIDLRAGGSFVYALSPGNGTTEAAVTVVDVSGGKGSAKMVQHFELKGLAGRNAMGMAVLV
ncbi:hypothetical protein QBC35DRAFT_554143 [Podospora australis]|uniref:3-carboxymuconate cyclase n=1 Tax=Podospora australis TaxID=1536484 RepID=A0AAN7AI09_9PEZI|nr:hypothetical protein QBC35DRAFT_554143 [Podospora australis]